MVRGELIQKYLPADYVDSYTKTPGEDSLLTVDVLFDRMFCDFPWIVRAMLKLRDILVKPFGLKTGASFRDRIIERNEEEMIAGSADKHLSFWVSVYCSSGKPTTAAVTTVVKFHNTMGKLYFAGIWLAHKLLVCYLFRRAINIKKNQ